MLPFLKNQKEASGGDGGDQASIKRKPDEDADFDSLEVAAEEILFAIEKKDSKALATAFRAAFDMCESQPHEENHG